MKRIIIAGSRNYPCRDYVTKLLDRIAKKHGKFEVVSGLAQGPDTWGKEWAQLNGFPVKEFPAQWNLHGRSAGYKRNTEMANYATHLIAFWDGRSRGTRHMIDTMEIKGLPIVIIDHKNTMTTRNIT